MFRGEGLRRRDRARGNPGERPELPRSGELERKWHHTGNLERLRGSWAIALGAWEAKSWEAAAGRKA